MVCGLRSVGPRLAVPSGNAQEEAAAPSIGLEQRRLNLMPPWRCWSRKRNGRRWRIRSPRLLRWPPRPLRPQTKPSVASARNRQAAVEAAAAQVRPQVSRSRMPGANNHPARLTRRSWSMHNSMPMVSCSFTRNQPWPGCYAGWPRFRIVARLAGAARRLYQPVHPAAVHAGGNQGCH